MWKNSAPAPDAANRNVANFVKQRDRHVATRATDDVIQATASHGMSRGPPRVHHIPQPAAPPMAMLETTRGPTWAKRRVDVVKRTVHRMANGQERSCKTSSGVVLAVRVLTHVPWYGLVGIMAGTAMLGVLLRKHPWKWQRHAQV